jgi:hypothetical protein
MNRVSKHFVAAAAFIALLFALAALAQNNLFARKWTAWTEGECADVLNDSPWVAQANARIDNAAVRDASGKGHMFFGVVSAQFLSALPIRQALVRQKQIESRYEQMTPEQRAAFDQKAAACLDAEFFKDKVVVQVVLGAFSGAYRRAIEISEWPGEANFIGAGQAQFVLTNGQKVRSLRAKRIAFPHCAPSDHRDFHFVFPRNLNGRPYILPNDDRLEFRLSGVKGFQFYPRYMNYNGKLEY